MDTKKKRIDSLQSLRAFAFLAIFASHADFPFLRASWGVSIFFILSGFLLFYNYCDKDIELSLRNSFEFAIKRIKRLYPLHIITMVAALLFIILALIDHDPSVTWKDTFIDLFLNISLTKSLVPSYSRSLSLNGVSWYLSSYVIICFIAPFIINKSKKNYDINKSFLNILLIFLLEIAVSYSLRNVTSINLGICIINDVTVRYFCYINPFFRLLDVYAGMELCKIYLNKKNYHLNIYANTFFELVVLFISIYSTYMFNPYSISNNPEWFEYSIMFYPISLITIYSFISSKGYLMKVLDNKLLRQLGDLSPYAFLIHHLVIRYFDFIFYDIFEFNINMHIRTLLCLVLTIIICNIYSKIKKK